MHRRSLVAPHVHEEGREPPQHHLEKREKDVEVRMPRVGAAPLVSGEDAVHRAADAKRRLLADEAALAAAPSHLSVGKPAVAARVPQGSQHPFTPRARGGATSPDWLRVFHTWKG